MDASIIDRFVGGWSLKDWSVTTPDGVTRRPYGDNPSGHIIYTANGVMSATFMAEQRKELGVSRAELTVEVPKAFAALKASKLDPLVQAFFSSAITFTGYCGTYTVASGQVTHHVETALIQDWVGTDLVRSYEFDEDCLILSAETDGVHDRLVWQRC